MGFKSGLNRVLFASRARELLSGAEKATAMTAETRALTCGLAKTQNMASKSKPCCGAFTRHTKKLAVS